MCVRGARGSMSNDWLKWIVRDGISAPTIISSGAATGQPTGAWRSGFIYTFMHSLAGTSNSIRFYYAVSPNGMTGVPPGVNASAKWAVMTQGATYSAGATGLRVIPIAEGGVGLYSRVGWTVAGTTRAKVSIWAGMKS
jgi:hypothetical protein